MPIIPWWWWWFSHKNTGVDCHLLLQGEETHLPVLLKEFFGLAFSLGRLEMQGTPSDNRGGCEQVDVWPSPDPVVQF